MYHKSHRNIPNIFRNTWTMIMEKNIAFDLKRLVLVYLFQYSPSYQTVQHILNANQSTKFLYDGKNWY